MKRKIKVFIIIITTYLHKIYNKLFKKAVLTEQGAAVKDYAYALVVSKSNAVGQELKARAASKVALLADSEQAIIFNKCYEADVPDKSVSREVYAARLLMRLEQLYETTR